MPTTSPNANGSRIGRLWSAVSSVAFVLAAALLGGCTKAYHFGANKDGTVGASTFAKEVDWLYMFIFWLSVICFVGICGAMIYFVIKYRRKPGGPMVGENFHSTSLEITWSVIPSIICVFIFYWGFIGFLDMRQPPKNAYEIQVTARQWSWTFTYPNGLITYMHQGLYVPENTNVRLVMNAEDVTHGFYVPAFRTKMDVLPGRFTKIWFNAKAGEYNLQCSEYCGKDHSRMDSVVHVLPAGAFEKKLEELDKADMTKTPAQRGEQLYIGNCKSCHSIDGSPLIGPTWRGLFNSKRDFTDGTSGTADENYLRESMISPMAKIVKGYSPSMPTFAGKLKEKADKPDIADLIAYIKSLK